MTVPADAIRILHVDDEPGFTEMAAEFLEREDDRITVLTATSAKEGLALLANQQVECIVSDYEMPGRNGVEFLEAVRKEHPDLPFILYTGKGGEEVASDAISAGVTDYLQKESGTSQYAVLANRITNAVDNYQAQRALADREQRLNLFFEQSPLGVIEWDERFNVARLNDAAEDILGYTQAELTGCSWEAIVPEHDRGTVGDVVSDLLENRGGYHSINENVRKDGERIVCEWHNRVVTDEGGNVVAIFSQFQDVTERRERQRAIEEQKRRLDTVVTNLPVIVFVLDADGVFTLSKGQGLAELGLEPGELVGHSVFNVYSDRQDIISDIEQALDGHQIEATHEVGKTIFDTTYQPVLDADGKVEAVIGVSTDVTERKKRERKLEALHEATRDLIAADTREEVADRAVDAVRDILDMRLNCCWFYEPGDDALVPVAWSDESAETLGEPPVYDADESLSWEVFETGELKAYGDVSGQEGRHDPETAVRAEIILPLGEHGVMNIGSLNADAFDEQDISLASLYATNVEAALDRAVRNAQVREEQAFFDQAMNALNDIFYVVDPAGAMLRWNKHMPDITGYTDEEITGMDAVEFFAPADRASIEEAVATALDTGTARVEADLLAHDGARIPYEVKGARLTNADGDTLGVVGIGRDISDRKDRERTLRNLQRRTEPLIRATTPAEVADIAVEIAHDVLNLPLSGVHLVDADHDVLEPIAVTDEVRELLGDAPRYDRTAPSRAADRINWDVFERNETTVIHDTTDDKYRSDTVRLPADEIESTETPSRSGIIHPLGDHGIFITSSPEPNAFDDTDVALTELLATLVTAALDRAEREAALSDQKRRLEAETQRLDAFTGVVSHDLRNPLTVAQGQLELAREECDSEHLDAVARAHGRMERLIEDLLALAHEGEMAADITTVDLGAIVETSWDNVETGDATLVAAIDRSIPADEGRLRQLLENLIRNAVEHGTSGEATSVTVTVGAVDDGFYIEDDGPGIPQAERDTVFEAGYSSTAGGTGLGLNIAKEVAEAHGWDIRVTTGTDGGARIEITDIASATE